MSNFELVRATLAACDEYVGEQYFENDLKEVFPNVFEYQWDNSIPCVLAILSNGVIADLQNMTAFDYQEEMTLDSSICKIHSNLEMFYKNFVAEFGGDV